MDEQVCRSFLLKTGSIAALVLIAVAFGKYLLGPLTPFLIALVIAALLQVPVKWMMRKLKMNSGLASTIAVILVYVIAVGIVLLLIIGLLSAAIDWASGLPEMFETVVQPWIESLSERIPAFLNNINPNFAAYVDAMLPDVLSSMGRTIMSFSVSLVTWASSVGTKLPGAMMAAVICVIATVFCTSDYDTVTGWIYSKLPKKTQHILTQGKIAAWDIVVNFAKSYLLIMLITFAEIAIGLLIIGFDNAFFIAAIIALFDILPIVGSGMILLPWTIYKFVQHEIGKGIGLLILYLFVVIFREIIEPRIVGKKVGLHPLATLLCMWLGIKVIGGIGIFALPIFVLIVKDLKDGGYLNGLFAGVPAEESAAQNAEKPAQDLETEEAT